jgi:hypothetical protein
LSLVTPLAATIAMAIIEMAPMGIALPIIAAIVPTKIASISQASEVRPSGSGIASHISRVIATAIAVGKGLKGSVGIVEPYSK